MEQNPELAEARQDIEAMMARARAAQEQIADYTQEQVDELITAMVWSVAREEVVGEDCPVYRRGNPTGQLRGQVPEDTSQDPGDTDGHHQRQVRGRNRGRPERNIVKIAKPVGVIGALSPSTNPEATPVIKGISAVKGRNAIIIAPHPRAKLTNKMICDYMREAIVAMGGPADLVQSIDVPSMEKTNELMRQCDRILATGGEAMVGAAYSSGTPALGVGVGNAVITVDDTADLDEAAEKIRTSKTLDLAASCSSDNSVLVFESVYDELLEKAQARGRLCHRGRRQAETAVVLWEDGHLNPKIVAQHALTITGKAGIDLPEGKQFLIVPETGAGPDYPFSGEKLTVTMALYKVKDIDEAIELTNRIQAYQGQGHSCGIYSYNDDNILKLAMGTRTSRVMVNQPQAASNSGNLWNGMRQTFSLGCGSWGGNSINHNITWRDLVNETWVSKPLADTKVLPSDEELFGTVMGKF